MKLTVPLVYSTVLPRPSACPSKVSFYCLLLLLYHLGKKKPLKSSLTCCRDEQELWQNLPRKGIIIILRKCCPLCGLRGGFPGTGSSVMMPTSLFSDVENCEPGEWFPTKDPPSKRYGYQKLQSSSCIVDTQTYRVRNDMKIKIHMEQCAKDTRQVREQGMGWKGCGCVNSGQHLCHWSEVLPLSHFGCQGQLYTPPGLVTGSQEENLQRKLACVLLLPFQILKQLQQDPVKARRSAVSLHCGGCLFAFFFSHAFTLNCSHYCVCV